MTDKFSYRSSNDKLARGGVIFFCFAIKFFLQKNVVLCVLGLQVRITTLILRPLQHKEEGKNPPFCLTLLQILDCVSHIILSKKKYWYLFWFNLPPKLLKKLFQILNRLFKFNSQADLIQRSFKKKIPISKTLQNLS